jgi:hypothetical protein
MRKARALPLAHGKPSSAIAGKICWKPAKQSCKYLALCTPCAHSVRAHRFKSDLYGQLRPQQPAQMAMMRLNRSLSFSFFCRPSFEECLIGLGSAESLSILLAFSTLSRFSTAGFANFDSFATGASRRAAFSATTGGGWGRCALLSLSADIATLGKNS